MGALNLGTQIEGLYKLVSVTKGKLFFSYKDWYRVGHMFLSQVYLCFYLTLSQRSGQK